MFDEIIAKAKTGYNMLCEGEKHVLAEVQQALSHQLCYPYLKKPGLTVEFEQISIRLDALNVAICLTETEVCQNLSVCSLCGADI